LPSHREYREALDRSAKEWATFNAAASNDPAPAPKSEPEPAPKDRRARAERRQAYYADPRSRQDLIHDAAFDRAQAEMKALAIVNVGKKRRGEPTIDKSDMAYPGDRRKPKDD
jgi:hypothetical protein